MLKICSAVSILLFAASFSAAQHVEARLPTYLLWSGADIVTYNQTTCAVLAASVSGTSRLVELDAGLRRVLKWVELPDNAWDVACSFEHERIYCAIHSLDNVTVLDARTLDIITCLPSGQSPYALCCTGDKVYCANWDSDDVTVIDAAGDSVLGSIPAGDMPFALCWNRTSNRIYCVNRESDNVTVIDAAGDSVLTTVTVGDAPWSIAWNETTNRLYVPNNSGGTVTIIDGVTNTVRRTVAAGSYPKAVTWLASANKAYCANGVTDGRVAVLCGTGDTLIVNLPVGDQPGVVRASAAANRVFVSNFSDDSVTVIDGSTNTVAAFIATESRPNASCVSPSGETLFVCLPGARSVAAIPVRDSVVRSSCRLDGLSPTALCVGGDGNRLWCANYGSDNVAVFDVEPPRLRTIVKAGDGPTALCADSFGRVYSANALSGNVTVFDASGDSLLATVPVGGRPGCLETGPTGDKVYCGMGGGSDTLFALRGGDVLARIPLGVRGHSLLVLPAAGKLYCAGSDRDSIIVVDTDADTVIARIAAGDYPGSMCAGPDGDKVYCVVHNAGEVRVVDVAGDSVVGVVPVGDMPVALCVDSVDGKVFAGCYYNNRLFVIDTRGDTLLRTLRYNGSPSVLHYSPATNLVYCASGPNMNPAETLLHVIDGNDERVVRRLGVPATARDMTAAPAHERVFLAAGEYVVAIHDPVVGIGEEKRDRVGAAPAGPTVARGRLMLAGDGKQNTARAAKLLNSVGRRVLDLVPGANDVRGLSPGVYFVRSEPSAGSRQPSAASVRKVVLTK